MNIMRLRELTKTIYSTTTKFHQSIDETNQVNKTKYSTTTK